MELVKGPENVRGKRPGRRGRRPKARSRMAEQKMDSSSKARIRRIPEITAFYRVVKQFHLRADAYKLLVFSCMNEMQRSRMRKLLVNRAVAS